MTEPEAGWFADPRGAEGTWRWWDGRTWTGWLSRDAAAAAPQGVPAEPAFDDGATEPGPDAAGEPAPDLGPTRIPLPLAVVVVVGAVILGLITIGAVVWASEPRLSTGPAAAPPEAAQAGPVVAHDGVTRQASVEEMRVVLPSEPYECESGSGPKPPLFTSAATCNALVHENYNAAGDDWSANFGLAVLAPDQVVPDDVVDTAGQVFDRLVDQAYAGQQVTVKNREPAILDIAERGRSATFVGEVHYDVPGLSSRYDRMVVIVVKLAGGDWAVCFSMRPDDTPKPTLDALNTAIDSLTAK